MKNTFKKIFDTLLFPAQCLPKVQWHGHRGEKPHHLPTKKLNEKPLLAQHIWLVSDTPLIDTDFSTLESMPDDVSGKTIKALLLAAQARQNLGKKNLALDKNPIEKPDEHINITDSAGRLYGFIFVAQPPIKPNMPSPAEVSHVPRLDALRQSLAVLCAENPSTLALYFLSAKGAAAKTPPSTQVPAVCESIWADAFYTALLNTAHLPCFLGEKKVVCSTLIVHSPDSHSLPQWAQNIQTIVEGQSLTRALTLLPPNMLDSHHYLSFVAQLAKKQGWTCTLYDEAALEKLGAGAFLSVMQGSNALMADKKKRHRGGIMRLSISARKSLPMNAPTLKPILVGKGICYDTGGHQLKPAKYMFGMHQDMNGSAVALGLFYSLQHLGLAPRAEAYLAIAENAIGPLASRPNEIVRAMNGQSIEIINTDAEGRMVLADTLALVKKHVQEAILKSGGAKKPSAINKDHDEVVVLDFATLTGSMVAALGTKMSGIISNRAVLAQQAQAAGKRSGERVVAFPLIEDLPDYNKALQSKVADLMQCRHEGEADHLYAALFLSRFLGDIPWVHMDLSACNNEGGLGASIHPVSGFGVHWGIRFIEAILKKAPQ